MVKNTRSGKPYWQKLSWHSARQQWKKFRDGKTYYLGSSGVNKSDRVAHDDAFEGWQAIEVQLQAKEERDQVHPHVQEVAEASRSTFLPEVEAAAKAYTENSGDPAVGAEYQAMRLRVAMAGLADHPDYKMLGDTASGTTLKGTIGATVDQYLTHFQSLVRVGDRSAARSQPLTIHLHQFRDWAGAGLALQGVNGAMLSRYHAHLLERRGKDEISAAYAHDLLGSVKQWVRWCWQNELTETLPRNLDTLEQFS